MTTLAPGHAYHNLLHAINHQDNDTITIAAANLAAALAHHKNPTVLGRFTHVPEVIFSSAEVLRPYGVTITREIIRRRPTNASLPDGLVVIWGERS